MSETTSLKNICSKRIIKILAFLTADKPGGVDKCELSRDKLTGGMRKEGVHLGVCGETTVRYS